MVCQPIQMSRPDESRAMGTSMIELLFVLAIVGVMARATGMLTKSIRDASELRSSLQSVLALAELGAYASRQYRVEVFLRSGASGRSLWIDVPGVPIAEQVSLPASVTLEEITVGASGESDAFRFLPDGSASPGRLTLGSIGGSQCTVYQALRGARRWQCHTT